MSALVFFAAPSAMAGPAVTDASVGVEALVGAGVASGDADVARITIRPEVKARIAKELTFDAALRFEYAGADTGLGTIETYGGADKPLEISDDARLEFDQLTLSWRRGGNRFSIGKQSLAWGELDGVQITDRFDAVRLREGPFAQERPDRLTRWGARLEFGLSDFRIDASVAAAGTVSQLANLSDAFAVRAPRSRGGIPVTATPAGLEVRDPGGVTHGVRVTRTFGSSDVSVLYIAGPETEPVFLADGASAVLIYPRRNLFGAAFQTASGARIFRLEAAYVPEQPVNLAPDPALGVARRERLLIGAGMDWDLPSGVFLNAQLALDSVGGGAALARPGADVIATLKAHKSMQNDAWRLGAEVLQSVTDGGGALRPQIVWRGRDDLAVVLGADLIWGDDGDLIGQFARASRITLSLASKF